MALLDLVPSGPALWVAGSALAAALAFGGVQSVRLVGARTDLATEKLARAAERATLQQAASEQAARFLATEHDWQDAQHENAIFARKARDLAAVDAAAAGTAVDRLRGRAATLAAACRGPSRDPAAIGTSAAASSPGDLFAELSGRLGAAGELVAAFAESAAISGEQCAADYQTLRPAPTPTKGRQ